MKPVDVKMVTPDECSIEILELPKVEIEQGRFENLIRTEAQLEFVKKWLKDKTSYNNYADISDLLLLLDIKKEQGEKNG